MVVPNPKGVEKGSDSESLFRSHGANFSAFDLLGFLVIGEDSNSPVHENQVSTARSGSSLHRD